MSNQQKSSEKVTTEEKEKPVCFVIMPIADMQGYETGHFGRVYEHVLKPAIIEAGYTPVRADDTVKTDYIVVGIIQKIVESAMVICDFSARNPNVMYELGIRHAFNKPVVLIKDRCTEKVFDIQGLRYTEYDHSLRIDSVHKDISKITEALIETSSDNGKGVNSVVQLAGIKAADIPVGQQVSGETQLILSALASLEKRVEKTEFIYNKNDKNISFDEKMLYGDINKMKVGDYLCDKDGQRLGTVTQINFKSGRVGVSNEDGSRGIYTFEFIQNNGLHCLPF